MTPRGRALTMAIALTISVSLLLTGLLLFWQPSSPELPSGNLPAFQSSQQLRSYLYDHGTDQGRSMYDGVEAAVGAEPALNPYHSKTNVQVAGVDEHDTVKTDGTYLFIVSADRVSIVKAYPASEMANVSSITAQDLLGDGNLTIYLVGIYILDDQLIIIGQVYESYGPLVHDVIYIWPGVMKGRTVVFQVDVSDKTHPIVSHRYAISGYHLTSRLIDDRLFLVTDQYIWYNDNETMPMVWAEGIGMQLLPQDIRFDPNASYVGSFTNILGIDLGDGRYNATSVLTSYTSVIYVSESDIYLTYVDWSSTEVWVTDGVGEGATTSTAEPSMPQTTIYRLELQDISTVPIARGEVDGYLLNQFSLDAKDGVLRLATTSGWQDQESMVYTLDRDLQVMGRLGGLGLNESIRSARFLEDTLYLVTFEHVDPLFVIDLSDPYDPTVLGELVMPGFSSYLHPIGKGLLLGVGTENSTLKLSLFNVSDPVNPVEVKSYKVEGWAHSDAQWDHKAVLFDERYGLLVVPVHSYDPYNWTVGQSTYVFNVSVDGIGLKGVLSNGETESASRSVVIEDTLFTISCNVLAAWSLPDLEVQGKMFYDDLFLDWYQYGGVLGEGGTAEGASDGRSL